MRTIDFTEYKHWYINKNALDIYVGQNDVLDSDSHFVGQSWLGYSAGAWVQLSDKQIAFKEAHPNASIEEVLKMALMPVPDPDLEPDLTPEELLERSRQEKIYKVYEQDRSTEQFTVNGLPMWLDKNTRTSLIANTLPAEKAKGKISTTLWYAGQPPVAIPVPIIWLEEKLTELELYAKSTYDTTQSHLAVIYSLSTVEEIEAYDISVKYPDKLVFILNEEEVL